MAKLFFLDQLPPDYHYEHGKCQADSSVERKAEELDVEAAFYWYVSGIYDGSGEIIMLKDDLWYLCSLGHCSCYGPDEHMNLEGTAYKNFDQLLEACSNEYRQIVNPLIQLIKDKGYGPRVEEDVINPGDFL